MKPEVRATWLAWNSPMEGYCTWMYLDVKGLVTTGVGNLIDSVAAAQALPWRKPNGELASLEEVAGAWRFVKAQQGSASRGGTFFRHYTQIRLSAQTVEALVTSKLDEMASKIVGWFPNFRDWEADRQRVVLSMAWAMGPGFPKGFPRFTRAMNAGDFVTAEKECAISEVGNPGVRIRNEKNRQLLRQLAGSIDIDVEC